MTTLKKISILVVLTTAASPSWSAIYHFCKVKKIYDVQVATPPKTIYENCAGVGYLVNGKDLAKVYCWNGATDLHEGLCEAATSPSSPSEPSSNSQEDIPLE